MTRYLLVILVGWIWQSGYSQRVLSDQGQISVLTCSEGDMLYSLFGHSAVRVHDPQQNIDWVFNYGTFNSFEENFMLKFLRGKLNYSLGVTQYDTFLHSYNAEQRSIKEQVLGLTSIQKQELFSALQENMKPENRFYQYDFFFDNCTTRIRDLLSDNLVISYPKEVSLPSTFRNLLHINLDNHPWTEFGMDLLLGASTDKMTTVSDQMFLPEFYYNYLNDTQHSTQNIVKTDSQILVHPRIVSEQLWISPLQLFGGLLLIEFLIFFIAYIAGDYSYIIWYDRLWFGLLFVCFLIFALMWLGTDHAVCVNNWNLIWTAPWMIFAMSGHEENTFKKFLIFLTIISSIVLLIGQEMIPQYFSTAIYFLIGINLLKALRICGIKYWIDKIYRHSAVLLILMFLSIAGFAQKMAGITMVAPPREFKTDPMPRIKEVNSNWVAFVPYAFNGKDDPEVRFGSQQHWWGERKEGIEQSIILAKKHELNVMLKPQVWMRGAWVGEMDYDTEEDWLIWEKTYREYILSFIDIANKYGVEMICIGTEFRVSVVKRERFWRDLIKEIRNVYKGKLTYSANWDSYHKVPIWDALDYIGISAYFPLADFDTPNSYYLQLKWRPIVNKLRKFSKKTGRPILFTEYGYLSVDGAAGKTWELEKKVQSLDINERAQANSLKALLRSFSDEEFWVGGFLWKWFPNGAGHEGYPERDYTPQGKEGEKILSEWYQKIAN